MCLLEDISPLLRYGAEGMHKLNFKITIKWLTAQLDYRANSGVQGKLSPQHIFKVTVNLK